MRAARITADFTVTAEMRAWAALKVPTVDIDAETERFRDYWLGTGRPMLDWEAVWRNWMRRAPARGGALYTKDQLRLKVLRDQYVADGFREPRRSESAVQYEFEYRIWARTARPLPARDMSIVSALAASKKR